MARGQLGITRGELKLLDYMELNAFISQMNRDINRLDREINSLRVSRKHRFEMRKEAKKILAEQKEAAHAQG